MASAAFLIPLVRGALPPWWVRKLSDAELVAMGAALRTQWDHAELFGEVETTPLFLKRLAEVQADVTWWSGAAVDIGNRPVPRHPLAERAALLQLLAITLARLAAVERTP